MDVGYFTVSPTEKADRFVWCDLAVMNEFTFAQDGVKRSDLQVRSRFGVAFKHATTLRHTNRASMPAFHPAEYARCMSARPLGDVRDRSHNASLIRTQKSCYECCAGSFSWGDLMRSNHLARLTIVPVAFLLVAAGAPPPRPVWNCGPPLSGWKTFRADRTSPVNTLVLSPANEEMTRPGGATWNGAAVTPNEVGEYTSLTRQIVPIPTLLLVVTYGTDCVTVSKYRRMIDETVDCKTTGVCVEVSP